MNNPRIILDSGAYTVFKKGSSIDINKYAEFITNYHSVFCDYFNLDVIGSCAESYKHWVYLRSLGVNTIPVFHIGGDEKYLQKYLKQTNYIGLGAVANVSSPQRRHGLDYIWNKYFLDANKQPTCRVHGLGITALSLIQQYPWYSVDSVKLILDASYGKIYTPLWRDNQWDYVNSLTCKVSSQGNHQARTVGSFLNFSPHLQERYIELIEQFGFSLGQITYIEKQKTRIEKKSTDSRLSMFPHFFDTPIRAKPEKSRTLADCFNHRLMYNLTIYNKLKENLQHPCIIYLGESRNFVKSASQFITPRHDILTSFAYMRADSQHITPLELYKANKPIPLTK